MHPSRVLAATLFILALSAVPVAAEDSPPPPSSPCVQQCTTDAKTTYMSCVAGGGSGEQCGQTARAQYLQCTAGCPTPPPPPPSGTPCLEQCGAQAEQAFRTCREQGGTVESCTASAKASYLQCAATNCANQQPPTCDARCTAVADGMEQRCLQEGNDAATCTAVRYDGRLHEPRGGRSRALRERALFHHSAADLSGPVHGACARCRRAVHRGRPSGQRLRDPRAAAPRTLRRRDVRRAGARLPR
ncbi:MAG: hypothetical protein E6J56_21855 [Deltaproteobacteria bacterium]|nr:MAG: hypothetical protein E6J56_21855 [Deltaproteobacteria bacterium]